MVNACSKEQAFMYRCSVKIMPVLVVVLIGEWIWSIDPSTADARATVIMLTQLRMHRKRTRCYREISREFRWELSGDFLSDKSTKNGHLRSEQSYWSFVYLSTKLVAALWRHDVEDDWVTSLRLFWSVSSLDFAHYDNVRKGYLG